MEVCQRLYQNWENKVRADPELSKELMEIKNNVKEIQDRFYKDLEFGTGGMRGIIGAGPNRINIYTIRKATQGLANYLNKYEDVACKKVVIAYDSRYKSREFALQSALILAQNNIKSYVFDKITPTPLLSYSVRELNATAGIVITASHNPKEYNGYKVYGSDGGQITDNLANAITKEIRDIPDGFSLQAMNENLAIEKNLLIWLQDEILNRYILKTKSLILNRELVANKASQLKIVYTPLHGTGLLPIQKLFEEAGFSDFHVVEEQAIADPSFPTLVCPNPEEQAACCMALDKANYIKADLVLATDPDSDRVGIAIQKKDGQYHLLTGNQTGALLIDYILMKRKEANNLPDNGIIIKTIVTSKMGVTIGKKYNIDYIDVLTGFKYIGEKIEEFNRNNSYTFLFGYEESYGYLIGDYVRDKDAVQTCLGIAEMSLYYKNIGKSLYERLQELYEEFGYYQEDLINIRLEGAAGRDRIKSIMDTFSNTPPLELQKFNIATIKDYKKRIALDLTNNIQTTIDLPQSNVVLFEFSGNSWCCVRPSGTEPKLKIYLGVCEPTALESENKLTEMRKSIEEFLKKQGINQV